MTSSAASVREDGPDTALARALLASGAASLELLRPCLEEVRAARGAGRSVPLAVLLLERGLVDPAALEAACASVLGALAAEPPQAPRAPRRFGPYAVRKELARGGMGVVYEVVHEPTGAVRALKTIQLAPGLDAVEERERFRREAEALARLDHPHVVPVHDADTSGPIPWLAQELLTGGTLESRLKRGPLPWEEALPIARKLASALERAHQLGLVHRDLKPGNVLFDGRGEPRIVDFGLVRDLELSSALTLSGALVGTPVYMSPEQARSAPADVRSDVYGLGAVLYAMLAGGPPFTQRTLIGVIEAVLFGAPRPLGEVTEGLPPGLVQVVERAMAKDPAARYESMTQLGRELARVAGQETPEAALEAVRVRRRVRLRVATLLALAGSMALLVGELGLARSNRARDEAAWAARVSAAWSGLSAAHRPLRRARLGLPASGGSEWAAAVSTLQGLAGDARGAPAAREVLGRELLRARAIGEADQALARGDAARLASALAPWQEEAEPALLLALAELRDGRAAVARDQLEELRERLARLRPPDPLLATEAALARSRAALALGNRGLARGVLANPPPAAELAAPWTAARQLIEVANLATGLSADASGQTLTRVVALLDPWPADLPGDVDPGWEGILSGLATTAARSAPEAAALLTSPLEDPDRVIAAVDRILVEWLDRAPPGAPARVAGRLEEEATRLAPTRRHATSLLVSWALWLDPERGIPGEAHIIHGFRLQGRPQDAIWLEALLDRARLGLTPAIQIDDAGPDMCRAAIEQLSTRGEWYARLVRAALLVSLERPLPSDEVGRVPALIDQVVAAPRVPLPARAWAEWFRAQYHWRWSAPLEAIAAFEAALELRHEEPDGCATGVADCLLALGRLDEARARAELAIRWADGRRPAEGNQVLPGTPPCATSTTNRQRVESRAVLVQVLGAAGEVERMMAVADEAMALSGEHDLERPRCRIEVARALGLCRAGRVEEARQRLTAHAAGPGVSWILREHGPSLVRVADGRAPGFDPEVTRQVLELLARLR